MRFRMPGTKVTLSQLPLAPSSRLVTYNLTPDPLTHSPSAFLELQRTRPSLQRRARLLDSSAHFSHVAPLPLPFPFRIDFPEDVDDKSEFIEGWLSHREATESVGTPATAERGDDIKLSKFTSETRVQERELLGVARTCLEDCFPNLDVGDAFEVIGTPALLPGAEGTDHSNTENNAARQEILDILSGHTVLASFPGEKASNEEPGKRGYAPWSLRYSGHQFGNFAGQLGDGRAISLCKFSPSLARHFATDLARSRSSTPHCVLSNLRDPTQRRRANTFLQERRWTCGPSLLDP
jgi:serine/tyrosine/threonine adenylyltransferase